MVQVAFNAEALALEQVAQAPAPGYMPWPRLTLVAEVKNPVGPQT